MRNNSFFLLCLLIFLSGCVDIQDEYINAKNNDEFTDESPFEDEGPFSEDDSDEIDQPRAHNQGYDDEDDSFCRTQRRHMRPEDEKKQYYTRMHREDPGEEAVPRGNFYKEEGMEEDF